MKDKIEQLETKNNHTMNNINSGNINSNNKMINYICINKTGSENINDLNDKEISGVVTLIKFINFNE